MFHLLFWWLMLSATEAYLSLNLIRRKFVCIFPNHCNSYLTFKKCQNRTLQILLLSVYKWRATSFCNVFIIELHPSLMILFMSMSFTDTVKLSAGWFLCYRNSCLMHNSGPCNLLPVSPTFTEIDLTPEYFHPWNLYLAIFFSK